MGNPTSQLTDQIKLLGVPEGGLRLAPIGDLVGEASIGLGKFVRSLVDQLLEIAINAPSFLFGIAHAEQRVYSGDQFIGFDRLDEIRIGAAFERAGAVGDTGESGRGL